MLLCCLLLALARADEPRIPRMIWQTWKTHDVSGLTHLRADATEELAAANPGWTRSLLNDSEADEFMRAHTPPYVYETYGALRPALGAARADLLRYALIAHHGGAYLDLDVACRPLDSFVRADDGCLLSPSAYRATVGGGALVEKFSQWAVVCERGHPAVRLALCLAVARLRARLPGAVLRPARKAHQAVLWATGPLAWSAAWDEYFKHGGSRVRVTGARYGGHCDEKGALRDREFYLSDELSKSDYHHATLEGESLLLLDRLADPTIHAAPNVSLVQVAFAKWR